MVQGNECADSSWATLETTKLHHNSLEMIAAFASNCPIPTYGLRGLSSCCLPAMKTNVSILTFALLMQAPKSIFSLLLRKRSALDL